MEKAIKNSVIQYDSKGNLVDVRSQSAIELYKRWQAGNRQRNDEFNEYERMKAHYEAQGQEPPYKTLAAFRRARRANELSPAFKAWRYRNRDAAQYKRWKEVIGVKKMPKSVDDFQKIKYNKNTQEQYEKLRNVFLGYIEYLRDNPRATPKNYQAVLALKEQGVKGKIYIPAQKYDVEGYEYDEKHINQERNHGITRKQAHGFVKNALMSSIQWRGKRIAFYSQEGVAIIEIATKKVVTAWGKDEFDEKIKSIIKELTYDGN